jgi:hypothetical protein
MLWAERQQQRVFGGRSLQLEIELTAEALSQRERPRLVDAAAKRRVQTSCMPPDSSKNRSSTSVSCVGMTPSAVASSTR